MSGWDVGPITSVNLNLDHDASPSELIYSQKQLAPEAAHYRFRQFLRTFKAADGFTYPYRDRLIDQYRQGQFHVVVDLFHLNVHDKLLHDLLMQRPSEYLPILEAAATEVARVGVGEDDSNPGVVSEWNDDFHYRKQRMQVQLVHAPTVTAIRQLTSSHVSHLVCIHGIIVSAGRPRVKPLTLHIICRNCKTTKIIQASAGFNGVKLPRKCDSRPAQGSDGPQCPLDPFVILSDSTTYIDQQRLKLQELTGTVPTGEMPRVMSLACDRYLCGSVKPGSRVKVTGMYTTYESNAAAGNGGSGGQQGVEATDRGIRIPYIRVMGIEEEDDSADQWGELASHDHGLLDLAQDDDDQEMIELSKRPNLYQQIAASMCPAIFDNDDTANIKQALAIQLFGGSRKQLPDGMRLRGDINMLLLGDPSVAKSQFLKFVSAVAPIGVYTSGKGSSAAGLTASVVRDPGTGEFHLEGGALVLADGGLVAIDEFDKMREQDRVAIHEAMEQQTISIAKAGITTILNARTSVLAAANPIFGRYDDMRSATDNIDFQTSILSRFDLIFIVRDIQDNGRDKQLAKHVLNVHRQGNAAIRQLEREGVEHIPIELLRRYIAYARRHCQPRLDEDAATLLKNHYVQFRHSVAKEARQAGGGGGGGVIPITVRQLEAIVRISEAYARMELSEHATKKHVEEAIRLFQVSTYRAAMHGGSDSGRGGGPSVGLVGGSEFDRQVLSAEREVRLRVSSGSTVGKEQLMAWVEGRGLSRVAVERALVNMKQRGEVDFFRMGKVVKRL